MSAASTNARDELLESNARKLNDAIDARRTQEFEYFGLKTLHDRYLLGASDAPARAGVAAAVLDAHRLRVEHHTVHEAIDLYQVFSSLDYIPSSPTLFNAGTRHEQLSSCFLLDSPGDSLESIYDRYKDVGAAVEVLRRHRRGMATRALEGSLIRATNGLSNGIVPWLKTLDSSGRRGQSRAASVKVRLAFISSRGTPTSKRSSNFVTTPATKAVAPIASISRTGSAICSCVASEADGDVVRCSIQRMCRSCRTCGVMRSSAAYIQAEAQGSPGSPVRARDSYARMMRTLAQTGNGWMTFKDKCNRAGNQTARAPAT